MHFHPTPKAVDPVLTGYLEAPNEAEAERQLSLLFSERADRIVSQVIRSKLKVSLRPDDGRWENQQALEVRDEARVRLLAGLRGMREEQTGEIADFAAYTAVLTYNACHEHLRRRYPARSRLKNRVRYLLGRHSSLGLWRSPGGQWIVGSSGSNRSGSSAESTSAVDRTVERLRMEEPGAFGIDTHDPRALARSIEHLVAAVGAPVDLDDLVDALVNLSGLTEARHVPDTIERADERPTIATDLERRDFLRRLWAEIRLLVPRQRVALLLNLRDEQGHDCLTLLPAAGVANLREIAQALEMAPDHLAAIWNDLPWDDARIAGLLGLTRQQVINLRKSARERLGRRLKRL